MKVFSTCIINNIIPCCTYKQINVNIYLDFFESQKSPRTIINGLILLYSLDKYIQRSEYSWSLCRNLSQYTLFTFVIF